MKLLNEKILTQYFIRDITSAITEYNRTFIVSAVLIIFPFESNSALLISS